MDRSFIINIHKELLLATKSQPTAFLIERRGVPLQNMDTLSRPDSDNITAPMCFMLGRQTARDRLWKIEDILEVAITTIEKCEGKEYLIIAFCALSKPEPAFTERRIEIRRSPGGNVTLLDSGEEQQITCALLPAFVSGVLSSGLSGLSAAIILLAAKYGA